MPFDSSGVASGRSAMIPTLTAATVIASRWPQSGWTGLVSRLGLAAAANRNNRFTLEEHQLASADSDRIDDGARWST